MIIFLFIILVAFVLFIVNSYVENRRLNVNEYIIKSKKIPSEFDGYKIVAIADLHNSTFGKDNKRLLSRINSLKPDSIIIAGDMLVAKPNRQIDIPVTFMKELSKQYDIYYANGNHEKRALIYPEVYGDMGKKYTKEMSKLPIEWLSNRSISIERNGLKIVIYGLDMKASYYKRFAKLPMKEEYLIQELGQPDMDLFNILIAHNPIYFEEYANWGADLTISGHNHGGMIRLPFVGGIISPQVEMFPKFDRGLFEYKNRKMILTSGLGNHTIKLRFMNVPEIVSITLKHQL